METRIDVLVHQSPEPLLVLSAIIEEGMACQPSGEERRVGRDKVGVQGQAPPRPSEGQASSLSVSC